MPGIQLTRLATLVGLAASIGLAGGVRQGHAADACDHACLEKIGADYLAAYLKRDRTMAPISKTVRFSENNVLLRFPDGSWDTVTSGVGGTLIFSDPKTGGVGIYTAVMQGKVLGYLAVRLKVVKGEITEIEQVDATKRYTSGVFGEPSPQTGPVNYPGLARPLTPSERVSRAKLIEVTNGYFNTLEHNNGTLYTKFGPNCQRSENGGDTTVSRPFPGAPSGEAAPAGPSPPPASSPNPPAKVDPNTVAKNTCWYGFTRGAYAFNNRVRDRDYAVVDEDKGLVLSRLYIDHKGGFQNAEPQTWSGLEVFKVEHGGELGPIRADFIQVPYYTASVWPISQPRPDPTPDIPDYHNLPPKN